MVMALCYMYTTALEDEDGNILWDDGQDWHLSFMERIKTMSYMMTMYS